MPTQSEFRRRSLDGRWISLGRWLASSDGAWLLDSLVHGEALPFDVAELLADFGLSASPGARARFARIADGLLREGC